MKGISIAIETVIFVILAVMVLAILLLFYNSTGGQSGDIVKMENDRVRLCADFVQKNPMCRGTTGGFESNLKTICERLGVNECKNTDSAVKVLECLKKCCDLYCP